MEARLGLDKQEETGCWPDNWPVLQVFDAMLSQWNMGGMGGVIGLRYEALPLVLKLQGIQRRRQRELFDALRVMERAAITEINKR